MTPAITQGLSWVVGLDGDLYGTCEEGGTYDNGTIFKITPNGRLTLLYNFSQYIIRGGAPYESNSDGAYPETLVLGPDGDLYGTATTGGLGANGTIFKITPSGTFTTLHSFNATPTGSGNTDGANPSASLVFAPDGSLYGTTVRGGTDYLGTVFKLTPSGTFSTLHTFFAYDPQTGATDGANPVLWLGSWSRWQLLRSYGSGW